MESTQLVVLDAWLQAPVGSMFAGKAKSASKIPRSVRMVENFA